MLCSHGPQSLFEIASYATDVRNQTAADELIEEVQRGAAGQQIAAVGATVVAERDLCGHFLTDERGADRHAGSERLADGDKMRPHTEHAEIERISRPA